MHRDCRSELGRCPTIGCAASTRTKSAAAATRDEVVDLPGRSQRVGAPSAFARLRPYSQLYWSGVWWTFIILISIGFLLWPLISWKSMRMAFADEDNPHPGNGGPICLLSAFGPVAVGLIFNGVLWLRRLPSLKREVAELLDRTEPIPMRITITVRGSGSDERREAVLSGGGYTLPIEKKGLQAPNWVFHLRTGTRVYVYGLPPPGPYLIEMPDGRLALWHPDD
ncbi:MAG: hypothetical protein ACAI25_06020, partial [Planctomycetota bacterium]